MFSFFSDTANIQLVKEWLSVVDLPGLSLTLGNLFFILVLIRWHQDDSQFDFRQALIDPATKTISFARLGNITAVVASTEWLSYECVKGRLAEWMFMGYLAAWAGAYLTSKYLDTKKAQEPPPTRLGEVEKP